MAVLLKDYFASLGSTTMGSGTGRNSSFAKDSVPMSSSSSTSSSSSSTQQVSLSPPDNTSPVSSCFTVSNAPSDCSCQTSSSSCSNSACSANPIRYANGEIRLQDQDLGVSAYGWGMGHTRSFSNRLASNTGGSFGNSWFVKELPQVTGDGSGNISVAGGVQDTVWFTPSGGSYVPMFPTTMETLAVNGSSQFVFTDTSGRVFTFNSLTGGAPGQLASVQDPYAHTPYTTSLNGSSSVSSITLSKAGSPAVEFAYAYIPFGSTNAGNLSSVVHTQGGTNVRQALFTYYGSSDSKGNLGDLKEVQIQSSSASSWVTIATKYYRYYTSNTSPGYQYGLKYVVGPQAYAAMVAASITPETASDATIAPYADNYFEYNSSQRVTKEVVNGPGIGSSSSSSWTYTQLSYQYTYSSSTTASTNFNYWQMRTTETLPDGNTNTVYTNFAGQVMLKVFAITAASSSSSTSAQWFEYYLYDSGGRVLQKAESSAVASFTESTPGLVTLNSSTGLIHVYSYYASGAATGYLQYEYVQQGSGGTAILLHELDYTSHASSGGQTVVVVSKDIWYQASGSGSPSETDYTYTWATNGGNATVQMSQKETTWPTITTGQNGSNTANSRTDYFDEFGYQTQTTDEAGVETTFQSDWSTGAVTQMIQDATGLALETDYTVDGLGRTTQVLGPQHSIDLAGTSTSLRRAQWFAYNDTGPDIRISSGYATGSSPSYTYTVMEPVTVQLLDLSGRATDVIVSQRASGTSPSTPVSITDSFVNQNLWSRWTHNIYENNTRGLTAQRVYYLIPASSSSSSGSSGVNYNETDLGYDAMGRQSRVETPGGTVTRIVYHPRGWVLGQWVGTDDVWATDADPTGGGAAGNNMVQITGYLYDSGSPGLDGNLTTLTQYQDSTSGNNRVTTYGYDFRNRKINETGEINVYIAYTYDNLSRVTEIQQYNSSSSSSVLIAQSAWNYDNAGRAYQRVQYAVNPVSGAVGNSLTDNYWCDPLGRLVKVNAAGSSMSVKTVFDTIGRVTKVYSCLNTSETGYPYPISVASATVFQQVENTYDFASNLIQIIARHRMHNASGTAHGDLGNPTTSPTARVYYQASWQDPLGRTLYAANYGTNAASSFTRPSLAPSSSATILVSQTVYDTYGQPYQTIDPKGIVQQSAWDNAGRLTQVLDNYVSGGTGADQNRETDFTYNADSRIATITAVNSVTGNQVTTYGYGTTLTNSDVASNDLVVTTTYPDSGVVTQAYNRQNQIKTITDQIGNVHTVLYDLLGRLSHDCVTTLISGTDSTVLRISRTYEVRGILQNITSYNNATVGSGSVVNDVQFAYNSFAQVVNEYQSHSGAVNTSTTPNVAYAYASGSANQIRMTSMTYPNGRALNYNFGVGGQTNDLLSRVGSLIDNNGTTHMADYTYLGLNRIVQDAYTSEPNVALTYIKQAGESNGDAGDQYIGLDRFGRVVDQRWISLAVASSSSSSSSSPALERVQYGFDQDNNRNFRNNLVASGGQDEYYTYDSLQRLLTLQRGTLNGGRTGIGGTPTWEEDFSFDKTGNWHSGSSSSSGGYVTKLSGTTTLSQNRTHTEANEIASIPTATGTAWTVPVYDSNGNATTIPQPASLGSGYNCAYDAWNRLMSVKSGGTTVSSYQYDGLNRRVNKTISSTRDYYYSRQWQILEERVGGSGSSDRQFVWGQRYADDLILRDCATYSPTRLYVLHDYFNPTATINTSGAILERYGYNAYGQPRYLTASFGGQTGSNYGWETLYGAYRADGETGLYQVRNRYLHSSLGGWISRDPLGTTAGLNLYEYGHNTPVNTYDSDGLNPAVACAAAVGLGIPVGAAIVGTVVVCGVVYLIWQVCKTVDTTCPPCPPPPAGGSRYDISPPSAKHYPCPGDHLHTWYWVMNQIPWPNCTCFPQRKETVTCIGGPHS
jgi:RHS repeat-associated protein